MNQLKSLKTIQSIKMTALWENLALNNLPGLINLGPKKKLNSHTRVTKHNTVMYSTISWHKAL